MMYLAVELHVKQSDDYMAIWGLGKKGTPNVLMVEKLRNLFVFNVSFKL